MTRLLVLSLQNGRLKKTLLIKEISYVRYTHITFENSKEITKFKTKLATEKTDEPQAPGEYPELSRQFGACSNYTPIFLSSFTENSIENRHAS